MKNHGDGGSAFPTGVGMNRSKAASDWTGEGVPHGRGDEPLLQLFSLKPSKRSPRAWG